MNPLNATNILLMDKHYSKAFHLWKSIHAETALKTVDTEGQITFAEISHAYTTFVKTLCGYAAHVLDFDIIDDSRYFRQADQMEITISEEDGLIHAKISDKERISECVPNEVHIPIPASSTYGKFSYDGIHLSWDNDVSEDEIEEFSALIKTRESRGKGQSEEKHRYVTLKQFLLNQRTFQRRTLNSGFVVVPSAVELGPESRILLTDTVHELEALFKDKQIVLALPVCDEGEQKVIEYSKNVEKTAIVLPLTMFDINSFRRLQDILLRYIVRFDKGVCPSCGRRLRVVGNQGI